MHNSETPVMAATLPPVEEVSEALDGHVGDGEEVVEDDPELLLQLVLVLLLQRALGWGQEATCTYRWTFMEKKLINIRSQGKINKCIIDSFTNIISTGYLRHVTA